MVKQSRTLATSEKAIDKLGRKHLKVSQQRKDFAIKTTPGAVK